MMTFENFKIVSFIIILWAVIYLILFLFNEDIRVHETLRSSTLSQVDGALNQRAFHSNIVQQRDFRT